MQISYLESLEQKYNFQYPDLYKQLCTDGMLDTGKFGCGWVEQNYDRIKNHPIFLIWSNDVELMEEFAIDSYIKDIKDPEIWEIKQDLQLIPFAQNGGGDWFCFYYNEKKGEDIPVVMIYHDDNTFVVMAKNLQDFIFRNLLETASGFYKEDESQAKVDKWVWDVRSMLNSHKKYLSEKQVKILEKVYANDLKKHKDSWGLISQNEADEIIRHEISFPLLGKEIIYYAE